MKKACLLITLLGAACLLGTVSAEARMLPSTLPVRVAEQAHAGITISFGGGGGCYQPPRRNYCQPRRYYRSTPRYYYGGPRRTYYNRGYNRGCR